MNDRDEFDLTDEELITFRRRSHVQALSVLLRLMKDERAAPTARVAAARGVIGDATARRHDIVDENPFEGWPQARIKEAIRRLEAQKAIADATAARAEAEDAEAETVTPNDDDVFG